jgi:hypothetical protein
MLEANTCRGQGWWRGKSRMSRSGAGKNAILTRCTPRESTNRRHVTVRRGAGHGPPPWVQGLQPLDDARIGRNIPQQCGWRVLPPPTPMTLWRPRLAVRIPVTQSVDGPGGHHPPLKVRAVPPSLMPSHRAVAGLPVVRRTGESESLPRNSTLVRQVMKLYLVFPGSGALGRGFCLLGVNDSTSQQCGDLIARRPASLRLARRGIRPGVAPVHSNRI